ncbi:protein LURP-one-related 10 [Capsicum galapagoense]
MAEPSDVAMATNQVAVIGSQYCTPNQDDFVISRKLKTLRHGEFDVSDMNDNSMFKVRGNFGWHDKRVIFDTADKPLVTLKQKMMTEHSRWNAYRGQNTDDKNFLFTVKTTSVFQWKRKTELVVFLANNNSKEKDCDFLIKGSWCERSCVIYAGDSSTIMHKKFTSQSLIGKDIFIVTVYPNIDHAFIVSIIVILDAINATIDAAATGAASGAAAVAVGAAIS